MLDAEARQQIAAEFLNAAGVHPVMLRAVKRGALHCAAHSGYRGGPCV
eukprot:CAMPEP_0206038336 /NCGR_PEP_ID=MMETSP1466-20131121/4037_1 /ASSEMBLY_ACC=CAM_ASM_001126 /TAXON_ID=44452 /ORGANISM="Pavlova gyrans, Strain CCMP608" /LENGTH=47 /DNA_ID= /DNA_START= /DNA_END= /DNA_ORIENTATION=